MHFLSGTGGCAGCGSGLGTHGGVPVSNIPVAGPPPGQSVLALMPTSPALAPAASTFNALRGFGAEEVIVMPPSWWPSALPAPKSAAGWMGVGAAVALVIRMFVK